MPSKPAGISQEYLQSRPAHARCLFKYMAALRVQLCSKCHAWMPVSAYHMPRAQP